MLLDAKTREEVAPLFESHVGLRGVFYAHGVLHEQNPRAFDRNIAIDGGVKDKTRDVSLAMDLLDYTVKPTDGVKEIFSSHPAAAHAFQKLAADLDHAAKVTDTRVQGAGARAVKRLGLEMSR